MAEAAAGNVNTSPTDRKPSSGLDVDFAFSDTIQHVLRLIRRHHGKIVDFDPEGPGGGNPNILLSFETKERALAFLREHSPGETDAFYTSRLDTLDS